MIEDIVLINFIDISEDEKIMVLSWRNNIRIKKWMFTNRDISLSEHLNFINNLSNRKDKKYFLVKKNDQYLGVIDFTSIKPNISVSMGLYLNPSVKGYGAYFIKVIKYYAFEILKVRKVFAEVFELNTKAYELYQRNGFTQIAIKSINGNNIICMECLNGNR